MFDTFGKKPTMSYSDDDVPIFGKKPTISDSDDNVPIVGKKPAAEGSDDDNMHLFDSACVPPALVVNINVRVQIERIRQGADKARVKLIDPLPDANLATDVVTLVRACIDSKATTRKPVHWQSDTGPQLSQASKTKWAKTEQWHELDTVGIELTRSGFKPLCQYYLFRICEALYI